MATKNEISPVSFTTHDEKSSVSVTITETEGFQAAYDCLSVILKKTEMPGVYEKLRRMVQHHSPKVLTPLENLPDSLNALKKRRDKLLAKSGWTLEIG